jgi:DNA topoisomerase-1
VKHGKVNATLPDQNAINTLTLEDAVEILAAKSGKGAKARPKAKAAPKAKAKARRAA